MKLKPGICQVIETQAGFLQCLPAPVLTPLFSLSQRPKLEILFPSQAACEDGAGIKGSYRVHVR